jgi:heme oxygenase (biliverdin-IX-beta and delta-forming)
MTPPNRRTMLRTATRESHRSLDALASKLDLSSLHDYGIFLRANARPLTALEIALEHAGVERWLHDWQQRTRRAAIAADLHALGLEFEQLSLPHFESRSEQLGVLYVLEGSRLGAQALAQKVGQAVDERVLGARAFLAASDTSHWRSFLSVLETHDPIDTKTLTAAALQAFGIYRAAFAEIAATRSEGATA